MTTGTVLIADDSLVIRAVVRSDLEDEGYRVIEAVDGLTALEQCRQDPPDVVLLDIEMPGLDGYQVLAALKSDTGLKNIPVVFLTSRSGMDDVVAGLRGGAHDYLKKPFEPAELLARVGSAIHVKKLQDQLQQRNAELDRISRTDGLTGLFNRRHLDEELARRNTDSLRHGEPICVLLLDIDHFKQINDTHGHPAGDFVLTELSAMLGSLVRTEDMLARFGGEEFTLLCRGTDLPGAMIVAERLRTTVESRTFTFGGKNIPVTISLGVAAIPDATIKDDAAFLAAADKAMYEAKVSGRNRVSVRRDETSGPQKGKAT
jgi:two-component system, cell cycle response regulator